MHSMLDACLLQSMEGDWSENCSQPSSPALPGAGTGGPFLSPSVPSQVASQNVEVETTQLAVQGGRGVVEAVVGHSDRDDVPTSLVIFN